jgi:gas vesicle protein
MSDSVGSKVSVFLVGLGIGALVGILFAPKSGEDTREYLSSKAEKTPTRENEAKLRNA